MERIIKITEITSPLNTKRASLKPGIYKEMPSEGEALFVVVGEDFSWDCIPYGLIRPFLNELHTLREISESEEVSQDVVPAWFALELVKALK